MQNYPDITATNKLSIGAKARVLKKAHALALLLIPIVTVLLAMIYITRLNNQKNYTGETEISIEQTGDIFQTKDEIRFILELGENPKITNKKSIVSKVFADQVGLYEDANVKIAPKLYNVNNDAQINLPLNISKVSETIFEITGDPYGDFLSPGGYRLEVEVEEKGEKTLLEQDFSWGVLAINTNKSVYTRGEDAKITMAVLNNEGDMVCDADVLLEISSPSGKKTALSTNNGTIKVNDGCQKKAFVWEPDFEAIYDIPREEGIYEMRLQATTADGTSEISDYFEVQRYVPFEVERITATRIYPRDRYPVIFKIKANENYEGTVKEIVPKDFKIFGLNQEIAEKYSEEEINRNFNPEYNEQFYEDIPIEEFYKELTWDVDFQRGQTYYLGYMYDAPNKSPNFFEIGELTIGERFEEYRIWQIAVDFTYELPHASVFSDTIDNGTNSTINVFEDVNNMTLSHATLNSAGFDDTETVLLIIDVNFDGGNAAQVFGIRIADTAGTAVSNTEHRREIRTATDRQEIYRWHVITTKTSGEGFVMQKAYHGTNNRPDFYKGSIIAIGLGDLEEGVEYVHDDDTSTAGIPAAGSPTTFAQATTPANMPAWDGEVLVLAHWKAESDTSSDNLVSRIDIDGTDYNEATMQGEDANDLFGGGTIRIFDTTDEAAHTIGIELENINASTTSFDHSYSSVIAFPAALFEDFEYANTDTSSNATTGFTEQVGITPFTPQNAGEFLVMGNVFGESNANNSDDVRLRIQVGGTNIPSGYDDTPEGTMIEENSVDTYSINWASLETFAASSQDIDLDAASDVTSVDFEDKTLVAFSMGTTNVDISGTLYDDDDEVTPIGSTSVCVAIDGVHNTNNCDTTNGSGQFTITDVFAGTSGTNLALYSDGGSTLANTITIADGADITGANMYEDHVVLKYETGSSITIADIDEYDDDENSTDFLFDATDSSPDTLTWESGVELFVPSGFTFAPGGNLNGHDLQIEGTYTAAASETINLDGSYNLVSGGTFTPSTSTLTFDATSGTEDLITAGTGDLYNLVIDDGGGGSLVVEVEDTLVVQNDITIADGTLDVVSGENNQINIGGDWDNDDTFESQAGNVVFDGQTATFTIDAQGTGNDAFYDVEFDDNGTGATYQLTTDLDVDDDLTIIDGTLDSNSSDIYLGGNWINGNIFSEGTNTVYLDEGKSSTLNTGCTDADSCTSQNFYNLVIDKGNGGDVVTLSPDELRVTNTMTITSGEFVQGTDDVRLEGSTALQLYDFGRYTNLSTGNITLGGDVINDYGAITLNANGTACGDADSITVTSTAAAARTWSGSGAFRLTDVDFDWMDSTPVINVASGTEGGNMAANFTFIDCSILNFEGLDFSGVDID